MQNLQDAYANAVVYKATESGIEQGFDNISTEVPIALVYNGISHVVLMATPQDLAELAIGFSLSEGIITSATQIYDVEVEAVDKGMVVNIELATEAFQSLKGRRRNMSGRTGCGLCGIESLVAVEPDLPKMAERLPVSLNHIRQTLASFDQSQILRAKTGSVHGVAWANLEGEIVAVFEDVGRHNALDKLIGWGLKNQCNWREGFVLVSSRASFEMVVKAAMAGIGCVVAVSAPTAYAIELADKANISLIGFARAHKQVIYTHPEYITE